MKRLGRPVALLPGKKAPVLMAPIMFASKSVEPRPAAGSVRAAFGQDAEGGGDRRALNAER